MEEQSDQLEKLKRELAARAGELARAQEALSRTEQVPASHGAPPLLGSGWDKSRPLARKLGHTYVAAGPQEALSVLGGSVVGCRLGGKAR